MNASCLRALNRAVMRLACAAIFCGGLSIAGGQTVEWHLLTPVSEGPVVAFTLAPASPTTVGLVDFVAPVDGNIYLNSCVAALADGMPAIAVDSTNRVITVSFSPPPTNSACPDIAMPVSGVAGQIGPLRAGAWVFNVYTNSYTFNVTLAPVPLTIQALTNSVLQLSWPLCATAFEVEATVSLFPAQWQVLTNLSSTLTNGSTVQAKFPASAGARYFRLSGSD